MEEMFSWDARRAEARALLARGEAMEALKVTMYELRDFSSRPCVLASDIDTSTYYTNPAVFGLELQKLGAPQEDIARFASILHERGNAFMGMENAQRAARDLEAAVQLTHGRDPEVVAAFKRARQAYDVVADADRRLDEARRVPVTVLTGFLGAGKTTLLNYILRASHGRKYAVIENEVGQIGIDNQLVGDPGLAARTAESITILDNGCLCCTVRDDLIRAVKQIIGRADIQAANRAADSAAGGGDAKPVLDGIIIETTGLADPGPVCKTFYADDDLRARTRIDGVLTLVDARHFLTQLQRERSDGAVNESAHQVGFADKILLNKTDAVDPATLQEVMREVRCINQVCPIVSCSLATAPDKVPLDELLGAESFSLDRVLQDLGDDELGGPRAKRRKLDGHGEEKLSLCRLYGQGAGHGGQVASRHDAEVTTHSYVLEGAPLILKRFQQVMNSIRAERAVDLYRYKGIVCVKEPTGLVKRAVLQGVHDMCHFEPRGFWPEDRPPKSQLVFIGRKLDRALWGRLLEKCKEGILDEGEEE